MTLCYICLIMETLNTQTGSTKILPPSGGEDAPLVRQRGVLPSEREMKKAVYSKDSSYDGIFFVAVKTTNIFCRPSCPARKPMEKNITF